MSLPPLRIPLLLAAVFLAGCDAFGSDDSFVPGEVIASVRHIEPAFAEAYAREHGIDVKKFAFPSVYLVQTVARTGNPEDYLAALMADPLVETARAWRGNGVEIVMRRAAEEEYARALVASQGGLDVVNVSRGQDLILFGVPKGDENRWVRRLSGEVFVIRAERNQSGSLR